MGSTALSRRELLAFAGLGVGVLALAGCRDSVDGAPADDAPLDDGRAPASSDDLVLARRTGRRVATLAVGLAGAANDYPQLRAVLRPLAARHREQVRAFAPDNVGLRFPTPVLPSTAATGLAVVTGLQRQAALATRDAALRASSGELASALASVAACMAQHVVVLEAASADLRGRS